MKKIFQKMISAVLLAGLSVSLLAGCSPSVPNTGYTKYSYDFFGTFDTVTKVVGYAKTQEEFDSYTAYIEKRFNELNKLYDIYNDYAGINNIKTINDNAGIKPVAVDPQIIALIKFAKLWHEKTPGVVNIALGSVLQIWHRYRTDGQADPTNAKLPDLAALQSAAEDTDLNKVIVDETNNTVFLDNKYMSLDVGAIAKGYSTEIIAEEVQGMGFISGIISGGGNVRAFGKPLDGIRNKWGIGIQDPNQPATVPDSGVLDTVYVTDESVVTSGDYQRFYTVDGKAYNHIIDPSTLFPADHYRAVTILCKDSGEADFMSTTAFILPFDESYALVESFGIDALWVMPDGTIKTTPGMKKVMQKMGGATYK